MFDTILENGLSSSFGNIMICLAVSLALAVGISFAYMKTADRYSKSMAVALVILAPVVTAIISAVNGNLGAGIAIMGVFALVRFRSKPANAKDIVYVLFDMTVGVIAATGYIFYTVVVAAVIVLVMFVLKMTNFGEKDGQAKQLKITLPENLDYENIFDDIFEKYLEKWTLVSVKTTNLGSLFELRYEITLKGGIHEKEMIDELRTRNGNLTILCARAVDDPEEL